jgi:hypothetical protein
MKTLYATPLHRLASCTRVRQHLQHDRIRVLTYASNQPPHRNRYLVQQRMRAAHPSAVGPWRRLGFRVGSALIAFCIVLEIAVASVEAVERSATSTLPTKLSVLTAQADLVVTARAKAIWTAKDYASLSIVLVDAEILKGGNDRRLAGRELDRIVIRLGLGSPKDRIRAGESLILFLSWASIDKLEFDLVGGPNGHFTRSMTTCGDSTTCELAQNELYNDGLFAQSLWHDGAMHHGGRAADIEFERVFRKHVDDTAKARGWSQEVVGRVMASASVSSQGPIPTELIIAAVSFFASQH